MDSLFEILYDVLFKPHAAMKSIGERKNVGQAFIMFLLSILLPIGALYFGFNARQMPAMLNIVTSVKVFGSLVMWIMGTAVWHFIAECYGGRGTALGLFAALGFAHIPRIFIVPLWALIAVMPVGSRSILMVLSVSLIIFWSLSLDVIAIKEVHQLSIAKSVLVIVTPLLIIALACAVGFAVISDFFMHMPMWL